MEQVCLLLRPGCLEYGRALALQRRLVEDRQAGRVPDLLILLEHPPVITLGPRAAAEDILVDTEELELRGISLCKTNRGGLATYHGPGQLVAYPISRLRGIARDIPAYVWALQETVIRFLAEMGLPAERDPRYVGVWVEGQKVCSLGVGIVHGITMHGFALNLQPDLEAFRLIVPCGIRDREITSVARLLGAEVDMAWTQERIAHYFGEVFGRQMLTARLSALHEEPVTESPQASPRS